MESGDAWRPSLLEKTQENPLSSEVSCVRDGIFDSLGAALVLEESGDPGAGEGNPHGWK